MDASLPFPARSAHGFGSFNDRLRAAASFRYTHHFFMFFYQMGARLTNFMDGFSKTGQKLLNILRLKNFYEFSENASAFDVVHFFRS
jgi:hypothetical protein